MQASTPAPRGPRRPRQVLPRRREQGVVAILVGMTIVVMVGMVGLAIDLGQMYVAKTELQNSADACALAGIAALAKKAGATDALDSADSAATLVARRHRVVFQDNPVGSTNGSVEVQFAKDNVAGPYQVKGGYGPADIASIRHVRCRVAESSIKTYFIQVLNVLPGISIGDQSVSAVAVARMTPSQLTCAMPVAICQGDLPAKGEWMLGVFDKNGDLVKTTAGADLPASSVKWVDFSGSAGGASEVSGLMTGDGECTLPVENSNLIESGVKASVAAAYNSRFGIYHGGIQPAESSPDFSGYAYSPKNWTTKKNAYKDYVDNQITAHSAYQGDDLVSSPETGTTISTKGTYKDAAFHLANGRDRRRMSAPIVDCSATTGNLPLKDWACVFMLHPISNTPADGMNMWLEYLGKANDPGSPCASNGVPGSASSPGPYVPTLVR